MVLQAAVSYALVIAQFHCISSQKSTAIENKLTIFLSNLLFSLYQVIRAAGLLPSATHLNVDVEPAISFCGLLTRDTDSGGTVDKSTSLFTYR